MFTRLGITMVALSFGLSVASAQDSSSQRVKTCENVRTHVGPDNTMTMDKFKDLMRAANGSLDAQGEAALDNQCKVTAYVKHVIMSQTVFKKGDGTPVLLSTEVVSDNGVCRLTKISIEGC